MDTPKSPSSGPSTPKYINIKKLTVPKSNSFSFLTVTPKELSTSIYKKKEELSMEDALTEGYLLKEGQKWKTWKKRWFVLKKNGELYYKKDFLDEKIIKKINIKGKTFLCPKQQYIKIIISEDFELNLYSSEQDHKLWINYFKKVGAECNINSIDSIPVSHKIMLNGEILIEKEKFLLEEFLQIGKKIGEGAQATVHLVTVDLYPNLSLAIKIYQKHLLDGKNDLTQCYNEINVFNDLGDHENIVQYYGVTETPDYIGIITEYCSEGNLFELIEKKLKLKLTQKIKYLIDFINSIEHLHKKNFIHRDLKLENILLSNQKVKLCDFGLTVHSQKMNHKFVGTSLYICPELFEKDIKYNQKTDIYAIGMIIYLILYEKTYPFEKELDIIKNIQENKDFRPNLEGNIPSKLKNLIMDVWNTDPKKRPSLNEIKNTLKIFL